MDIFQQSFKPSQVLHEQEIKAKMFANFIHTVEKLNQGRDYKIVVFPSGNNTTTTQIIHKKRRN
jgi:1-acyl-sn-glycerol-3-phosphate acyltransferase